MPQKRKILLLDTGKEWGGGTNSMLGKVRISGEILLG